jgi:predicted adenylyl cyclase CyaB
MGANVEIKARVRNPARLRESAETVSDGPPEVIRQEDTFFRVERGRLKLRVLAPDRAELIRYDRSDAEGPTRSDYLIHPTDDPDGLLEKLSAVHGVRGVVRKTRHLYLAGQTRIHLDEVEGLGTYMELEVVLRDDQSTAEGTAIARDLMTRLEIDEADLVEQAYIDLLEAQGR